MYANVPALLNVTDADAPGRIGPVVHERSRATMVWVIEPLLTHVTAVPTATCARTGLTVCSDFHSYRRPVAGFVSLTIAASVILSVSRTAPRNGSTAGSGSGAACAPIGPPI